MITTDKTSFRRLSVLIAIIIILSSLPALWFSWHRPSLLPPRPWPGKTISYYNKSNWQSTLQAVVRQWNQLHFGLRFVPTVDAESADLIITLGANNHCHTERCNGHASQIGYLPYDQAFIYLLSPPTEEQIPGNVQLDYVDTIAHELGHILGLNHQQSNCSLMKTGGRDCPNRNHDFIWDQRGLQIMCGPFANDLRELEDLYSVEQQLRERPWCLNRLIKPPDPINLANLNLHDRQQNY